MRPDAIALLGRVLMSAIFIQGGYSKATHYSATLAYLAHLPLPGPTGAAYVVAVLVELAGGIAVLIGWRTRWAAAVLAAWCVALGFAAHYRPGDTNNMIHFMKNLCMAGGFLQLAAWGAGRFSVDRS